MSLNREKKGLVMAACVVALVIFISSLFLSFNGVEGRNVLSKEEDSELERQLEILNKPAIKTIKYGDIYDCVDIYKQHAFDHPLLKNHRIMMKPSSSPKKLINEASSPIKPINIGLQGRGCPSGTVPIRRTRKEDLITAKLRSKDRIYPNAKFDLGTHYATIKTIDKPNKVYHGVGAHFSVYNPKVSANQSSSIMIKVQNGPADQFNEIVVGWTVNPPLYGDNRTRLYSSWTADAYGRTGCNNDLCPGFVQIDFEIPLDKVIDVVSVYRGDQYENAWAIKQDSAGNWWFLLGRDLIAVGYWPKEIFTSLNSSASRVEWGGVVVNSTPTEDLPEMGSGYFPTGRNDEGVTFRQLKVVNEEYEFEEDYGIREYASLSNCYKAVYYGHHLGEFWGMWMMTRGGGEAC